MVKIRFYIYVQTIYLQSEKSGKENQEKKIRKRKSGKRVKRSRIIMGKAKQDNHG